MTQYSISEEVLGDVSSIGLPTLFLSIAIGSFIWFAIEIKKKRIMMKSMVGWLVLNIIFTILIFYILIISILHVVGVENAPNIFNIISTYLFGLRLENGKQWIIFLILGFITYILIKTLANSIKIARLTHYIDELNKNVAILSGKVNKTFEIDALSNQDKTQVKHDVNHGKPPQTKTSNDSKPSD